MDAAEVADGKVDPAMGGGLRRKLSCGRVLCEVHEGAVVALECWKAVGKRKGMGCGGLGKLGAWLRR